MNAPIISYFTAVENWLLKQLRNLVRTITALQQQNVLRECREQVVPELNRLVTQSESGINTIFIYDFAHHLILCHYTQSHQDAGKLLEKQLDSATLCLVEALTCLNQVLNHFGKTTRLGPLKHTVFQLTRGILDLYCLDGFKVPLVLGFISEKAEGLGLFISNSNQMVNAIEAQLKEVISLKQRNDRVVDNPSAI
ncbi:MAG: hypothetical protein BWK78_01585 [Thiotrichaceae bacterium IS1]|nr:MAG: hypothetical protein BWK78_01585 [Thiotrichaceae bacterium IS1]